MTGTTPFLAACEAQHIELASLLLDRGSLLTEEDKYGNTAVLCCAQRGSVEFLKWLQPQVPDLLEHKNKYHNTGRSFEENCAGGERLTSHVFSLAVRSPLRPQGHGQVPVGRAARRC